MSKKIYKCKNCGGEVTYKKGFGWCHVICTGCIEPAVLQEDWKTFLANNKESDIELNN